MDLIHDRVGAWSDRLTRAEMHDAAILVMRNVFDTYAMGYIFSEADEMPAVFSYCGAFASVSVWIQGLDIIYIVRTNTAIGERNICELWFSEDHMTYNDGSFLTRLLRDFSSLVSEVCSIEHTCDNCDDMIPSGTYHTNGSWFCSEHEDSVLRPRHYYEGNIDYDAVVHDPSVEGHIENDWDTWTGEVLAKMEKFLPKK